MKLIQNVQVITEITEEQAKNVDLFEFEQDLYKFIKSEADENADVNVEVLIED